MIEEPTPWGRKTRLWVGLFVYWMMILGVLAVIVIHDHMQHAFP